MKKSLRKMLSMVLAVVMIISLMPVSAFADSGSYDQIMNGYYQVGKDSAATNAKEGVTFVEQDGYKLTKSIAGTNTENVFDITLKVETAQTVEPSDAAIVLVVDNSITMSYCGVCGKQSGCNHHADSRMKSVKKILTEGDNSFLNSLLKAENTGNIYVSVVSFGTDGNRVCDWTDIKTTDGMKAVKNAINGLSGNEYATNMHAGLTLARNLLNQKANATTKYVVLLSDGQANCYAAESTSTSTVSKDKYCTVKDANGTPEARDAAAGMATTLKGMAEVFAVGYGVEHSYLNGIIGNAANVFVGTDSSAVNEAFGVIAQSAVSGMNGAGTSVKDPMGQYINFTGLKGDAVGGNATVANDGTISWKLDPEKANKRVDGNTTYYTYTMTYTVTLDTAAEGFEEGKYYPTNGYTYLNVPATDKTEAKEIPFLVPGVKGTIPEYDWTVKYYLEDESSINKPAEEKTYTLDKTDTTKNVDLWTVVNAPEGYANKYNDKGYHFAKGIPMQIVIKADESQNVIELYYNLNVAQVTVEHYYKTTTITPAGETIVGEYPATADKTSTQFALLSKRFEATEDLFLNDAKYDFDKAEPGKSITVMADEKSNVIKLYYSREDDQRKETAAQVDHIYETYSYKTNAETGKYEQVVSSVKEEKVQYSEDLRATTLFNVSANPMAGKDGYVLDTTKGDYEALVMDGGKLGFVLKDNAADNIRTLYFKKEVDNREKFQVTVNHHYTKNVTTIDADGQVQVTTDPNNVIGSTDKYEVYKGDSLTIAEVNRYNGEYFTSDAGNAAKIEISQVNGEMSIDLFYEASVTPKLVDAFANHYWRTFTEVTVEKTEKVTEEVINPETNEVTTVEKEVVIGTEIEERVTIDHQVEKIKHEGLYEGQKHIEDPMNWGSGYTLNAEDSDDEAIAGSKEANLFYDKHAQEDARRTAEVTVIHNYVTKLETIVDGEIAIVVQNDGKVTKDTVAGRAGDEFEAEVELAYNGNDYTCLTDEDDLSIVLQPGTNTIVINYEREASNLVEVAYEVNYEYLTYTMTIDAEGKAGYWTEPAVANDHSEGKGYVGQKITIDPKAKDEFALKSGVNTIQYLQAEGNTWTFVYEQYIPLEKGSVTVNHHYKTITIAENGTPSEVTQDVPGAAVEKYIGEAYTAEAVLDGFTLTGVEIDSAAADKAEAVEVTVGENTVIDFYYEKTDDFSVPVTYSIAHEYYTYDWDGTLLSESKPDPLTGTGFATNAVVAAPEYNDYTLASATYNGSAMTPDEGSNSYTVILREGENKIVFVYEKTLARDLVDVTVIHNYFKDEAAMAEGTTESKSMVIFENQPEGSEFTAEKLENNGYSFISADPEAMSIIVNDEGENVIVINYIRDEAAYNVIHVYKCNGTEEGRTSQQLTGLHGEVISADSVARVTTYNGNTYSFVSASEDITLDSAAETLPAIILTYNRTVSNPPYNPPIVLPDQPPIDSPDEPPVIEIPDEDVPLTEIPEEDVPLTEIPDEEVPLSGVPVTGDTMMLWMAISAASGAGLYHFGRRRKDDE